MYINQFPSQTKTNNNQTIKTQIENFWTRFDQKLEILFECLMNQNNILFAKPYRYEVIYLQNNCIYCLTFVDINITSTIVWS